MTNVRKAAVAGTFYAGSADQLHAQIEACYCHPLGPGRLPRIDPSGPRRILGLVSPHAGYIYSGPVAAHAFATLAADGQPEVAVIIGPNHYGWGPPVSVSLVDGWQTPLGTLAVDRPLASSIASALAQEAMGEVAHQREHSLEVQLPFLQHLYGDAVRIVAITMADQSITAARKVGKAVGEALAGRNAVVIASTDMTHYESHGTAVARDRLALVPMMDLQPERLLEVAFSGVSMCGPGPVAAILIVCRSLGAERAELLRYATSGDVTNDRREVVGYAALAIAG